MKLYVLRHAQALSNVKGIIDENPEDNFFLTKKGEQQALTTAEKLKDAPFDAIYVSEFNRTQQTAKFVNQYHTLQLIVDERLNEVRTGFNREPYQIIHQLFVESEDQWNTKFKEGESFEESKARVKDFLEELRQQKHETVLVVTHGDISMIIHGLLNNLSNEEMYEAPYPQKADYRTYDL